MEKAKSLSAKELRELPDEELAELEEKVDNDTTTSSVVRALLLRLLHGEQARRKVAENLQKKPITW
jgi:hypothetical protein